MEALRMAHGRKMMLGSGRMSDQLHAALPVISITTVIIDSQE